jgi:membrane protease YdiL (CAAX protease family)
LTVSKFQLTIISLALAAALWAIVFLIQPIDFWSSLSLATALLLVLSLFINGENPKTVYGKVSIRMILYGVINGLLLYGLFSLSFEIIRSTPFLLQGVNSVYEFRSGKAQSIIMALLIFPIAPGEETYWRGLVQRRFSERIGPKTGLLLAAFAYALVHLPTLNPMLIITAFIGGLAWGALYQLTDNLVPVIISHTLWDILIFVVLPLA